MYSFWFRVILGGFIISFTQVNLKIESSLSGLAGLPGGVYHHFYLGKTDFSLYLSLVSVCLYICTGISLHILISWPFRMGSHWQHWTAKSWLTALAVLNGGVHHQFYLGKSENLNFFLVLRVHHHRSFRIYYTKDLMTQRTIYHCIASLAVCCRWPKTHFH